MESPETVNAPPERRLRERRAWQVPGLVYAGDCVTEVELRDISREVQDGGGVGFISTTAFEAGQNVHLKVGIGPLRHPRPARVAYCRRRPDGKFWIGVTLGASVVQTA